MRLEIKIVDRGTYNWYNKRHGDKFKCSKCQKPFKKRDKLHSKRGGSINTRFYHLECWETQFQ